MNRKYLAGICLILSEKLNDVNKKDITKLIDCIVAKFRIDNRKEFIAFEFPIVIALEFNLKVKYEYEFAKHYERLLANTHMPKSFFESQKKLSIQHSVVRSITDN